MASRAAGAGLLVLCVGVAWAGEESAPKLALESFPMSIEAPAVDLPDMFGVRRSTEEFRGKVLVVNFWATWCGPCREEFPALDRVAQRLRDDGVVVLGINVGDKPPFVERFLRTTPVTFPILLDSESRVTRAWNVVGLPATFIVTPDGKLESAAVGMRDWDHPVLLARLRGLAVR